MKTPEHQSKIDEVITAWQEKKQSNLECLSSVDVQKDGTLLNG